MRPMGDKKGIWLFTIAECELLPDGFELDCINGKKYVKGRDYIDMDTRFGMTAFGVIDPLNHPNSELLTFLKLRGIRYDGTEQSV